MKAEWLIPLISIFPTAVILHWAPISRRAGTWFSVTVSPDFQNSQAAHRLLARYRVMVWTLSLVAFALSVASVRFLADSQAGAVLLPGAILVQIVGAMLAFLDARRRTRPYAVPPSTVRSASLLSSPEGLPGGVSGALAPFGLLAATALYIRANWHRLPDRFPIHWGISGQPDRWAGRDWQGAYGMLLMGALLVGLLLGMAEAILRGSPRGRGVDAEWTVRFRSANLRLLIAISWGLSALFSFFSLSPFLLPGNELPVGIALTPILAFIALILAFIWPVIRISQEPGSPSDATPDECWKLGMFYYNSDDPAIFVQKRFGVGYALNYGNRTAWALIGMFVLFLFGATALAAERPRATGDWLGKLNANGVELRVAIHLKQAGDDTWSGTLDSLDQGAKGIPLQHIRIEGDKLSLEMGAAQASYQGRLDPVNDSIT